ncbi:hypothetical protein T03_8175 [Trichinella britovi]|uniref:Uncharacterized protein n=1 Tax=Trichinella britovi TaxID=45882 RepID=A0A0V1D960_TRIBR|nr:hypothetical protein T03_8175 [Trichinella britovi]
MPNISVRRSGLLRAGFDPLPQRTISNRRALGSMTERHAVQPWLLQNGASAYELYMMAPIFRIKIYQRVRLDRKVIN